jgi:hypothetical protein
MIAPQVALLNLKAYTLLTQALTSNGSQSSKKSLKPTPPF